LKHPYTNFSKSDLYEKLEDYYNNNSLYEEVIEFTEFSNSKIENLHYHKRDGQRNPVHRTIEFYVGKVIPGDQKSIKISAKNQTVVDAINQVMLWSNFAGNKQRDIRKLTLHGNLFYKVNTDGKQVWFDIVDSKYITDYKEDSKGYITEIRIDTPVKDENDKQLNRVEYWNKSEQYYSIWQSFSNSSTPLSQLGTPVDSGFIKEVTGNDFLPFVHIKFIDAGYLDGLSAVSHVLSKIEEANKIAKRLHDNTFRFNKKIYAVSSNAENKDGSPIPAPELDDSMDEADVLYLPGKATITHLESEDYNANLAILNAQLEEIDLDLPETRYYKLSENNVSGKALKLQLGAAISKAEEARGNYLSGFTRIIQMCLSIGSFWNLFSVGTYENGDYEFSVNLPEMFPTDESDKATLLKDLVASGMAYPTALRVAGYSEEFINQAVLEKASEDTQKATQNLNAFNSF
jgi:hypothetical protein